MEDKELYNRDIYDKYHKTPGDTSQGRWLSVLLCIIGVLLAGAGIFLYLKCRHIPILMIAFCFVNVVYTYAELRQLFIRKYWFRYHMNLAIALALVIFGVVMLLFVLVGAYFFSLFTLDWYCVYIPFILMPAIVPICMLFFGLLFLLGA